MPHLENDPFMVMVGKPWPKHIILSTRERAILQKAKAICESAEALLPEAEQDDENDYSWAAIYLRYVLME